MKKCECCGNEYDKIVKIEIDGKEHFFDCFECAIHKLAPICKHCGCRIIGHGIESDKEYYCCNHCSGYEMDHEQIA